MACPSCPPSSLAPCPCVPAGDGIGLQHQAGPRTRTVRDRIRKRVRLSACYLRPAISGCPLAEYVGFVAEFGDDLQLAAEGLDVGG